MQKKTSIASVLLFCFWIIQQWILGCTSFSNDNDYSTPRGSAPAHPAAFSQDHFTYNKDQSKREANDFEFYYKHCSVDDRQPFPVGAIWQCTPP